MPYINDLQSYADISSPVDAAVQGAIQNQQADQQQALANQKAQAELPYVGQQAAADAAYKQAGAGLLSQQGNEIGLKNLFTSQTMPGDVSAANAGNQLKVSQDQVEKLQQLGQISQTVAAYMDSVPQAARPAAMQEILQKNGIDPRQLGPLASGDPDMLRNFSQKLIQGSAMYQTELMKQNSETDRATQVAGIQSDARVTAAEASANARMQAAHITAQMRQQQQTFEQAAVQAQRSGNQALAAQYTQAAMNLRQAQASITGQLVGSPMQNPFGNGGSNAPSSAPQGPSVTATQTPQGTVSDGTYEYRQTADGQWQRRKLSQ